MLQHSEMSKLEQNCIWNPHLGQAIRASWVHQVKQSYWELGMQKIFHCTSMLQPEISGGWEHPGWVEVHEGSF